MPSQLSINGQVNPFLDHPIDPLAGCPAGAAEKQEFRVDCQAEMMLKRDSVTELGIVPAVKPRSSLKARDVEFASAFCVVFERSFFGYQGGGLRPSNFQGFPVKASHISQIFRV